MLASRSMGLRKTAGARRVGAGVGAAVDVPRGTRSTDSIQRQRRIVSVAVPSRSVAARGCHRTRGRRIFVAIPRRTRSVDSARRLRRIVSLALPSRSVTRSTTARAQRTFVRSRTPASRSMVYGSRRSGAAVDVPRGTRSADSIQRQHRIVSVTVPSRSVAAACHRTRAANLLRRHASASRSMGPRKAALRCAFQLIRELEIFALDLWDQWGECGDELLGDLVRDEHVRGLLWRSFRGTQAPRPLRGWALSCQSQTSAHGP